MGPFVPRRFLRNGHLQTIVGNFLPRTYRLPEPESRLIEVEPATAARGASLVLCHCHWQPAVVRSERLTILIVHGLEGSSSSRYVLGNSARALAAGCNVVRMNMRSCGDGEEFSPSIYHSGRSGDVALVMAELARERLRSSTIFQDRWRAPARDRQQRQGRARIFCRGSNQLRRNLVSSLSTKPSPVQPKD